jgi:hypothetical protein
VLLVRLRTMSVMGYCGRIYCNLNGEKVVATGL